MLFQLKTRGPQSAGELATKLEITPMAVRQHLAALEDECLVEYRDERRSVGRPARIWRLDARASERFPDGHAELTVELLEAMRESLGERALDQLIATRSARQLDRYRESLPGADAPLPERLDALAQLRSDEGYMAEWQRDRDGYLMIENHCPICAAARACQGLCRDELELFRSVLGQDVTVERTEHALLGARRCAYRIRPVNPGGAEPS